MVLLPTMPLLEVLGVLAAFGARHPYRRYRTRDNLLREDSGLKLICI
jgi:hypothetical protein